MEALRSSTLLGYHDGEVSNQDQGLKIEYGSLYDSALSSSGYRDEAAHAEDPTGV